MFRLLTRLGLSLAVAFTVYVVSYLGSRMVAELTSKGLVPATAKQWYAVLLLSGLAFSVAVLVGSLLHVRER